MDTITEKMLLAPPEMINFYRFKYQIYNELNLSFDLFFNEDIINYNQEYYWIRMQQKFVSRSHGDVLLTDTLQTDISYHKLYNPYIRVMHDTDDITIGTLRGIHGILKHSNYIENSYHNVLFSSIYTKTILVGEQKEKLDNMVKYVYNGEIRWV